MKFESTEGIYTESLPRETLFQIHKGESFWTLTRKEAETVIRLLRKAVDYEYPRPDGEAS